MFYSVKHTGTSLGSNRAEGFPKTGQHNSLKSSIVAGVGLLIVAIVIVFGALAVTGNIKSSTATLSSASGSTFVTSSTACTQMGVGNIQLTVKNSSTQQPIVGLPVQIKEITGECQVGSAAEGLNLGSFTTDANGTVLAHGEGTFLFAVNYNNSNYSTTGNLAPMGFTCVTLYIPSGQVTYSSGSLSQSGNPCIGPKVSTIATHNNSTS